LRLPREPEKRTCVICQRIYPETNQQTLPIVAQPSEFPAIRAIQQSLPSALQSGLFARVDSKESLETAYCNLARELVRLTESLGRYDIGAKEYEECLARVRHVVETMHMMKR
jgi:hypothetical protein